MKIDVIPNRLEKFMHFFKNKNFKQKQSLYWQCMQLMNSSLDKLVKHLSDDNFKYLTEEFGSKNLELLKQTKKMLILMCTWTVLKDLVKKNCLINNVFTVL